MDSGIFVGDKQSDIGRGLIGVAGQVEQATHGLGQGVHAWFPGQGTVLTKAGNRAHDQLGIQCLEIVIAEPVLG